jgi:pyruvoyl-dependent arginine decarboxylase (PvlArgDC)
MLLVRFENRDELFLINEEDKIFKGAYLPDVRYATKDKINEFKEKYRVEIKVGLNKDDIEKMLVQKGYSEEEAEEIVKKMVEEGFANRGWELGEFKVASAEITVREKPAAAVAVVVMFPY